VRLMRKVLLGVLAGLGLSTGALISGSFAFQPTGEVGPIVLAAAPSPLTTWQVTTDGARVLTPSPLPAGPGLPTGATGSSPAAEGMKQPHDGQSSSAGTTPSAGGSCAGGSQCRDVAGMHDDRDTADVQDAGVSQTTTATTSMADHGQPSHNPGQDRDAHQR
jgi:hypothetical protein